MNDVALCFKNKNSINLFYLGNLFLDLNRIIGLVQQIDSDFLNQFSDCEELSSFQKDEIISKLSSVSNSKINNRRLIEIKKIFYNSPLEILFEFDMAINVAILLLGGKRTGLYTFEIKEGLLSEIRKLIVEIKNKKNN
jgi:hypothetical protein